QEGLTVFFHDTTLEHNALDAKEYLQRAVAFRAEVSNALSKSDASLDAILQECAEAVVRLDDAALAQIWLGNETKKKLELQTSAGKGGPHNRSPGRTRPAGLPI